MTKKRKLEYNLPESHVPYTDKYFLRSKEILEKDKLNPWVKYQVFIRKGPGILAGVDEAISIIRKYSQLEKKGGTIKALYDGDNYEAGETVITLEGPLQELIELETMYLGVISAETTLANGGEKPNLEKVAQRMKGIVGIAKRPVLYFGARHWKYDLDSKINKACFKGGASGCSTQIGADTSGKKASGTIPHALILAYGSTLKAAEVFDKYVKKEVDRIVLIDTFNKEITDSIEVAKSLKKKLWGVRIDTCGENTAEGSGILKGKYVGGKGVTIEAVKNLRYALNKKGFDHVKIVVSSGFNKEKTKAFVKAEKKHGRLFDAIGSGSVFDPDLRIATSDIVRINGKLCHKVGRPEKENERLEVVK